MNLPSLKPCKWDFAVAIVVLILAFSLWYVLFQGKPDGDIAYVYHDGVLLYTLPLSVDNPHVVVTADYENVISVKDGAVFFLSSDCPNEDCVHSGKISKSGQSLICLPNRVTVIIEGGVDAVVK